GRSSGRQGFRFSLEEDGPGGGWPWRGLEARRRRKAGRPGDHRRAMAGAGERRLAPLAHTSAARGLATGDIRRRLLEKDTGGSKMAYAQGRAINDADSHIMESLDWLPSYADPAIRERLVSMRLEAGGSGAAKA